MLFSPPIFRAISDWRRKPRNRANITPSQQLRPLAIHPSKWTASIPPNVVYMQTPENSHYSKTAASTGNTCYNGNSQ